MTGRELDDDEYEYEVEREAQREAMEEEYNTEEIKRCVEALNDLFGD